MLAGFASHRTGPVCTTPRWVCITLDGFVPHRPGLDGTGWVCRCVRGVCIAPARFGACRLGWHRTVWLCAAPRRPGLHHCQPALHRGRGGVCITLPAFALDAGLPPTTWVCCTLVLCLRRATRLCIAPVTGEHGGALGGPVPLPLLTTWTHSIRGRRTAWLPERLTTQAGVSGVPSSRAMTASTPIRLPCGDRDGDRDITAAPDPLYPGAGVGGSCLPGCGRRRRASHRAGRDPRW